jgi:hypothetical protein
VLKGIVDAVKKNPNQNCPPHEEWFPGALDAYLGAVPEKFITMEPNTRLYRLQLRSVHPKNTRHYFLNIILSYTVRAGNSDNGFGNL